MARAVMPETMRAWLFSRGSLTARLVAHCAAFEVRLLRQAMGTPLADQRERLGMRRGRVVSREVLLCCDGVPVVYAQTALPAAHLAAWPFLRRLGARSLGSRLYTDARIDAGALQAARLAPRHALAKRARMAVAGLPAQRLPARRRLYRRGGTNLLVTELFLPAVMALNPAMRRRR